MRRLLRPHPECWLGAAARALIACLVVGQAGLPAGAHASTACVQPGSGVGGTGAPQGGIGGTGAPSAGGTGGTGAQADSGLGGTGAVAGGIGGTGAQADSGTGGTGIVGTITGFASVCIGDLEVHFDAATPVSMNGVPSTLNRLAIGQVVAMEAGPGRKGLTARSIAILHALEGPVTRTDAARGVFEVMGQPVRLGPGIQTSRLAPGNAVRVSGLRDARGVVHATRVEPAVGLVEASAIGFLRRVDGLGSLDGLKLAGRAGAAPGAELLVRGKWDGRQLQVREQRSDPSLPFAGRVRDVVVEGLVHDRGDRAMRISGFEVRLEAEIRSRIGRTGDLAEGSRVRVVGRIEPGRRIVATRVEIERGSGNADGRSRQDGRGSGGKTSGNEERAAAGSDGAGSSGRGSGANSSVSESRNETREKAQGRQTESGGKDHGDRATERKETPADRTSRAEKAEKSEKVERAERTERSERTERIEKSDRVEKSDRLERSEKPATGDRSDRTVRTEKPADRTDRSARPESGRDGRH